MKRLLFIAITLIAQVLTCATQLYAQDDKTQKEYDAHVNYTYAERYYENGYFDQAISILDKLKNSQDATMRSSAYRLTALCHIEMGDIDQAKLDVQQLLAADPYFSPSASDNPILLKLINTNKRSGGATITTASQQAETIEESPVPVTLITEEMLKAIGARTLKDALLAYVPGMTDIASNDEMNIAMRGIYSTAQSKILTLIDGHRINSYSTNAATLDYSMSLEKIKQIEVLRGPASSIYGGVALTSVVNIITKEGNDIEGTKVKGSIGNYGQLQGDILFGKRYMNMDVMVWANIFNSTGQKFHEDGTPEIQPFAITPVSGDVIIDGFNSTPTFDIGTKLSLNGWKFMYNIRNSKSVSSKSLSIFFAPYSYDKYRKINGSAPGIANLVHHGEIEYSKQNKKWSWGITGTIDAQTQQRYQVGGDTIDIDFEDIHIIPYFSDSSVPYMSGAFQSIDWNEFTIGAHARGSYNYDLGKSHKGSIMFGGHVSQFSIYDWRYVEGVDYTRIVKTYDDEKVLNTGSETSMDSYMQIKHSWKDILVFNGGIRYDYKHRNTQRNIHQWSPRIALILNQPKYDVKLSVSKSFVDAPYFYRNNTLDIDCGNDDLDPEKMLSFQLSFYSANKLVEGLTIDANIFYNKATDVITKLGEVAVNSGMLEMLGGEMTLRYKYNSLTAETNMTYQKVLSVSDYSILEGNVVPNIPQFKINAIVSYNLFKGMNIHASANINAKQTTYVLSPLTADLKSFDIPAYTIINAGADYTIKNLQLAFNINNLLNKNYKLGGVCYAPLQQKGLWLMGSVAYKF